MLPYLKDLNVTILTSLLAMRTYLDDSKPGVSTRRSATSQGTGEGLSATALSVALGTVISPGTGSHGPVKLQ